MADEDVPDLRKHSVLANVAVRLLRVKHEPQCDHHCKCVERMLTERAIVRWLLGLLFGAVMMLIVKWVAGEVASRLTWEPPPANSAERMGADRVRP